ncbi:MAG: TlpA disulfide reductase family protein [Rhodothalassiaceae bacterium]
MNDRHILFGVLALLLLAAGGWAAYGKWGAHESTSATSPSAAPAASGAELAAGAMTGFVLARELRPLPADLTFEGPDGLVHLDDYRGQVLLINLWAEWCAPCIEELPTLDRLAAKLAGPEFRVVPISLDSAPVAEAQAVLEKYGASHLTTLADRKMTVMAALGIAGLPTTILVDRKGRELGRFVGPADWSSPGALALVRSAIDGGA